MGAALFVRDARGKRFEAAAALEMFARYPITTFFAPPTAYRMFVQESLAKYRFPTLRHCLGAGEAVNPEVIRSEERRVGKECRYLWWEGHERKDKKKRLE